MVAVPLRLASSLRDRPQGPSVLQPVSERLPSSGGAIARDALDRSLFLDRGSEGGSWSHRILLVRSLQLAWKRSLFSDPANSQRTRLGNSSMSKQNTRLTRTCH